MLIQAFINGRRRSLTFELNGNSPESISVKGSTVVDIVGGADNLPKDKIGNLLMKHASFLSPFLSQDTVLKPTWYCDVPEAQDVARVGFDFDATLEDIYRILSKSPDITRINAIGEGMNFTFSMVSLSGEEIVILTDSRNDGELTSDEDVESSVKRRAKLFRSLREIDVNPKVVSRKFDKTTTTFSLGDGGFEKIRQDIVQEIMNKRRVPLS